MSTSIGKLIRAMRARWRLRHFNPSRRSHRDELDAYLVERLAKRGSQALADAPQWVRNVALGRTRRKSGECDRRSPSLRELHLAALIRVRASYALRMRSPEWVLDMAARDEHGRPAIRFGRQR